MSGFRCPLCQNFQHATVCETCGGTGIPYKLNYIIPSNKKPASYGNVADGHFMPGEDPEMQRIAEEATEMQIIWAAALQEGWRVNKEGEGWYAEKPCPHCVSNTPCETCRPHPNDATRQSCCYCGANDKGCGVVRAGNQNLSGPLTN